MNNSVEIFDEPVILVGTRENFGDYLQYFRL